jgi:hypothetical protein
MLLPPYAPQATVMLTSAIPTVDQSGNVVLWTVGVSYSLGGYTANYQVSLIAQSQLPFVGPQAPLTGPTQPPTAYAQADLLGMCPVAYWNSMFESQYSSVMVPPPPPTITVQPNFSVATLPPGNLQAVLTNAVPAGVPAPPPQQDGPVGP